MLTDDNDRYQRVLHRMHIATERKQPWWGLCPIRTKLRFQEAIRISMDERERIVSELQDDRRHWYLTWLFSRQPSERVQLPDWLVG
ncbi:MAG: hypothetical protein IPP59_02425 [Betaproteobacteria bacterium]|jgi:hypothetical protein|nr:hypothetical protein [Candidatus Dechloromonas phosphorivorans]